MTFKAARPTVLFVCARNGGKSQMAAGLMEHHADGRITVMSAGTAPGTSINALSAESLAELGIDISGGTPKPVTDDAQHAADVVVILGSEARVQEVAGTRYERWETDEPSTRGIEGMERMRLVRDDIDVRVHHLLDRLLPWPHAGESGDTAGMDLEQWWPAVLPGTRDWLINNNGDALTPEVAADISRAGGLIASDPWWIGERGPDGIFLSDAATDWIEARANGE
ncbi:MAG: phosphatase [Micrococcaceae bacterium]|jgi:arsenate-mycothiol transferase|nr:phosphatase [Micrococcaceae bacterium]